MSILVVIALILGLIGIAGGIIPGIPGPPVSWVGLLLVFLSPLGAAISLESVVIWLIVMVIVTVLDFFLPGKIAKMTGGHKEADRGALIGLFLGMIFTPVGMLLGCFLGALLGEMTLPGQDIFSSTKAAFGAFLGIILSTGLKVIYSAFILWLIVMAII